MRGGGVLGGEGGNCSLGRITSVKKLGRESSTAKQLQITLVLTMISEFANTTKNVAYSVLFSFFIVLKCKYCAYDKTFVLRDIYFHILVSS